MSWRFVAVFCTNNNKKNPPALEGNGTAHGGLAARAATSHHPFGAIEAVEGARAAREAGLA